MEAILFLASAKEMKQGKDRIDISLSPTSEKIINKLQSFSLGGLQEMYRSSLEIAEENQKRFQNFSVNLGADALDLYNGIVFKNMCLDRLSSEEIKYIKNHTVILSALYGPIFGWEKIKPYRLDFNMGLQVEGKFLKQVWRPYCTDLLSEYKIFNLASAEFSSCLERNKLDIVDVEFYLDEKMMKKPPSATVKKLRGQLVYYLAKNTKISLHSFDSISLPGYHLRKREKDRIIYVKNCS